MQLWLQICLSARIGGVGQTILGKARILRVFGTANPPLPSMFSTLQRMRTKMKSATQKEDISSEQFCFD